MTQNGYNLFFTGRDDPRSCTIIGEDTKPLYYCFETTERGLTNPKTTVNTHFRLTHPARTPTHRSLLKLTRNNKEVCAHLSWSPGNHLGSVTIGSRQMPMSQLVMTGTCRNARAFVSSDGKKFEWRRRVDNPTSYDLYSGPSTQIAAFRRYSTKTAVGPSHGLLSYTFNHDTLLVEALISLCLNRWIDLYGV